MLKFKKKNALPEQAEQPVNKKKKKRKWILIGVAVLLLLFLIIVGSCDSDDEIPTIADNLSDHIELYSEEKADGVTRQWYKIDPEELSLVADYVDLLCDEYDFETVDGKDNDYYLVHTDDTEIGVLYTDNGGLEYHIRIGIPDEGEDQSIIGFIYVDGLFKVDEKAAEDDEKTADDSKEDKKTEDKKNSGKDEVLVAALKADTSAGQKQGKASVKFQSMFDYFPQGFTFSEPTQSGLSYIQNFEASENDEDAVEAYIEFLCSDGMNFTLADEHYEDFRGMSTANSKTVFAAWALTYNGTASVEQKCDTAFIDGEKYALTIYYTIEYGEIEGVLKWSVSLESTDLGFRTGGKIVDIAPGGKSASTGLIRKADGKYETSDGRFSANLNEAVILKNGKTQRGMIEYTDNSTGGDCLKVTDGNANKLLCVVFPCSGVQKTGLLLDYNDLLQKYQFPLSGDPYGDLSEDTQVYQYNGSKWLTATYSDSPCKDMTFRIVYYNETEQVAVYYIYAYFTEETEAFCVVDLSKATKDESQNSSGGGSGSSSPLLNNNGSSVCAVCKNKGKTFCNRCNGTGKIVIRGSIAGFGTDDKKSFTENKGDCPECDNGYKDCSYCD